MADKPSDILAVKVLKLLEEKGHTHLKVTTRASNIVIYSQHARDKENRCRFAKISGNTFSLHMADHKGKWEPTPFTGTIDELVELVSNQFGWVPMDL